MAVASGSFSFYEQRTHFEVALEVSNKGHTLGTDNGFGSIYPSAYTETTEKMEPGSIVEQEGKRQNAQVEMTMFQAGYRHKLSACERQWSRSS